MPAQLFDIYFSGQILEGQDPSAVRQRVGAMFKANESQVARMFSGQPVRVKAGVDQDTAVKYRVAFRNAGALVEIRKAGEPVAAAPAPATVRPTPPSVPASTPIVAGPLPEAPAAVVAVPKEDAFELLPPRSGSLLEFAPADPVYQGPEAAHAGLAARGEVLDETPPPPPAAIDTSALSAAPPNSGSLEAFAIPEKAVPIPDISALKLDEL